MNIDKLLISRYYFNVIFRIHTEHAMNGANNANS